MAKKSVMIMMVIGVVIIGGSTGYLVWRANQPETVAPTESNAGGGGGSCCSTEFGCVAGWKCDTSTTCGDTCENPIIDPYSNACGTGRRCRSGSTCNGGKCTGNTCQVSSAYAHRCVRSDDDDDDGACKKTCIYPKILVSGRATGDQDVCRCVNYTDSGSGASSVSQCTGNCPGDSEYCGNSVEHDTGASGCQKTSRKCRAYGEPCHNPTYLYIYCRDKSVNSCEGGGLLSPTSLSATVGDTVTVEGYAYDADGINTTNVAVQVDGTVAGNAAVANACPSGNAAICSQYGTKNPVIWSYDVPVTQGDQTVTITWQDTKGKTSVACSTTTTLTGTVQQNPDWTIGKTSANVCLEADPLTAQATYVITVTNTGDVQGQLTQVVDTMDANVDPSYVQTGSIVPAGTVNGNVITWTLSGADAIFDAGETKEYRYTLQVPESAFGTFTNSVVATPVVGDAFSTQHVSFITCDGVPDTGLFDSTVGKIMFSLFLLTGGLVYMYYDGVESGLNRLFSSVSSDGKKKRSRDRFEKRFSKD